MGKVQQLSNEVIARIAAGEVIERPAFAVKELVENAIDAEAQNIEISIRDSGLTEITVIDDGGGMSKEDVVLSILPHATSKIKNEEDLLAITSLGFRGEGLSSLASISHLTIASRPLDSDTGFQIEVENGVIKTKKSIGMPVGTRVTALKLLDAIPGRRKFLKSKQTELRHIVDYIAAISLSYPSIHFRLLNNGQEYLSLEGSRSERLVQVFGDSVAQKFMYASEKTGLLHVDMYISHPEDALPTTQKLIQFVNNRRVSNSLVSLAIKEAYGKLLDPYSYPVGVISIDIPHQFVDVNVHPTKKEVRFESSDQVFHDIKEIVQNLLTKYNLTFGSSPTLRSTKRAMATDLRAEVSQLPIASIQEELLSEEIIVIDNTFLITAGREGLLLFDQHAVHEALLYEAYVEAFEKHKTDVYVLQKPELIELTLSEYALYEEHEGVFKQMGFDIEKFGGTTIKLSAVPKLISENNISHHLKEMLVYFAESKHISVDRINNQMIAFLACKSAIKAGDRLTKDEAAKLISALTKENSVYTCPHGRPVKRVITVKDLQKMFKRI